MAGEKEADFEEIALKLGLDIEAQALQLVSEPSPKNTRQTVRKISKQNSRSNLSFASRAPSFTMHMIPTRNNNEAAVGLSPENYSSPELGSVNIAKTGQNSVRNLLNRKAAVDAN